MMHKSTPPHKWATENRTDMSDFVIHLTRAGDGKSARENLVSMLRDRTLFAATHHNLFSPFLSNMTNDVASQYNVVCLTEAPFSNIRHFVDIPYRKVKLEPYGLVFAKEWVAKRAGNPVFYVYEDNPRLKQVLSDLFEARGKEESIASLLAFVSKVGDNYVFDWEREWHVLGDLHFSIDELVALICPEADHGLLKSEIVWASSVPLIDIEWGEARIMAVVGLGNAYVRELLIEDLVAVENAYTCRDYHGNKYIEYENLCEREVPIRNVIVRTTQLSKMLKHTLPNEAMDLIRISEEIELLSKDRGICDLLSFNFDIKRSTDWDKRKRLVELATKGLDRLRVKLDELRKQVEDLSSKDW